jgi:alkanesulfonate monooxygenase SsuD/methylene tetrahydromethanopterin reductase-like flavin-dependent oxidoreductase (luciferase family)
MKIGVALGPQNIGWREIRDVAVRADRLGFGSLCLFDHLLPLSPRLDDPVLETWTTMGALADATERIRLGTLVTANTLRAPALLAKMVATVDHVSGGRVFLGLGAGYYVAEHRAYGIELPPRAQRAAMLDEACAILKGLWGADGARFSFRGSHYAIEDAPFAPACVQPGGPPLLIGGAGALTLRTAARHADLWNLPPGSAGATPEDLVRKVEALRAACREEGREAAAIEISVSQIVFVERDRARARERRRQFAAARGMAEDVAARHVLAEDPAGVRDAFEQWRAAGAQHLSITLIAGANDGDLEPLAEEVLDEWR